jgi:hypothetical protein
MPEAQEVAGSGLWIDDLKGTARSGLVRPTPACTLEAIRGFIHATWPNR